MAKTKLDKVDSGILERIKKALTLAAHAGTGEQEARQAMRMANKLMQAHNVSQADIMATETQEQKVKRAGASVVTIRSTTGAKVLMASWTSSLAGAMETFFNVKSYSTTFPDRSRITWTFYGLAEGTVAAARAMEWCHNLILTWSANNKSAKGRNAKNLYSNGVADGLFSLARAERRAEERAAARAERVRLQQAAREEAAQRAAEIARLDPVERKATVEDVADEPPMDGDEGYGDSDSDGEYAGYRGFDDDEPRAHFDDADVVDESMDLDAALRCADSKVHVKARNPSPPLKRPPSPTPAPPKVKPEPQDDGAAWASTQQLTRFRSDATAIADAFLQEHFAREAKPGQKPQKLKERRKAAPLVWKDENGRVAYEKGKEDAKNIEVRRKRIESAQ
ncbi:hypothetical protein AURDEDRAFT_143491 [Auricularia subglabra TFB-10046 SS5]|nr:hypothetical protein AURDEDRAFT_143491 [Auricularia subglabra TFB-10046 SS5]